MARKRINLSATPVPDPTPNLRRSVPDWHLCIDFGTTFTTIAFIRGIGEAAEIFTIEGFPGDRLMGRNGTQVPTEIQYLTRKDNDAIDDAPASQVLHGYEISRRLELTELDPARADYIDVGYVKKAKLLLDNSSHLKGLRQDLLQVLNQLKAAKKIRKNEDVIRDLFVYFLQQTKEVLERDVGFKGSDSVEITVCVPVCWNPHANATVSACAQEAMRYVGFGADATGFCNLFMVNEAEAAAAWVLTSKTHKLKPGQTFILLDCGGGTTDVGTYTIARDDPLRLGAEVNHPQGAVCGAGDLNDNMRKLAMLHLKNERYLVDPKQGLTIENLVDSEIMPFFENEIKRSFSLSPKTATFSFRLRGLETSESNPRLKLNALVLSYQDMLSIFQECFDTIDGLMRAQITHALSNNINVDKVVLVGGFGDNPALKQFLTASLVKINKAHRTNIVLVTTTANTSAGAVATGGVVRAQSKDHGPKRVPCQSIGVIRHVPYEPETYSSDVLSQGWEQSETDREYYIMRTIEWIIKVGDGELSPVHLFSFKTLHHFSPDCTKWVAEEQLYASDTCTDDFYTRFHVKNKGKTTEIGSVKFDITHLQAQIQTQTTPDADNEWYEIELLIEMKVIDRNLQFTARWPANDQNAAVIQGSQAYFNLVSAFAPGTA